MVPFPRDGDIFLLAHSGEYSIILYIWYIFGTTGKLLSVNRKYCKTILMQRVVGWPAMSQYMLSQDYYVIIIVIVMIIVLKANISTLYITRKEM